MTKVHFMSLSCERSANSGREHRGPGAQRSERFGRGGLGFPCNCQQYGTGTPPKKKKKNIAKRLHTPNCYPILGRRRLRNRSSLTGLLLFRSARFRIIRQCSTCRPPPGTWGSRVEESVNAVLLVQMIGVWVLVGTCLTINYPGALHVSPLLLLTPPPLASMSAHSDSSARCSSILQRRAKGLQRFQHPRKQPLRFPWTVITAILVH